MLVVLVPYAVVTVMSTTPPPGEALAGDVTVALVDDETATLVPAVLPNLTVMPLANPVPVSVTDVPPAIVPLVGLTPVTVGNGSKVYRSELFVALVPCDVVTVTLTVSVPAGAVAVMLVEELTTTPVAGVLPNSTVAPAEKWVPVIVTELPPAAIPCDGLNAVTVTGET